jgi:hypothetical protein
VVVVVAGGPTRFVVVVTCFSVVVVVGTAMCGGSGVANVALGWGFVGVNNWSPNIFTSAC